MFSGEAPKLIETCPPPRCGSACDRPDRDVVGLAHFLAQDVAQRNLEDISRGRDTRLLVFLDRRIGKEAQDRLGAGLAPFFDDDTFGRRRKLDPEVG